MFIEKPKRMKRGTLFYIAVALVLVIGAGALGAQLSGRSTAQVDPSASPSALPTVQLPNDDDPGGQVVVPADALAEDPVVTVKYIHDPCGHSYEKTLPTEEVGGLTKAELMLKYPTMEITSFTATGATMECHLKQYCPQHYMVKLENGQLVIYRTQEGTDNQLVIQRVDIDPTMADPNYFKDGVMFNSLDEVESLLENLSS